MILQALNTLYDRLATDDSYGVAKWGYSRQNIAYEVVIHPDGGLHQVVDIRSSDGGQPRAVQKVVPGQSKPSGSGLSPGFLWDNPSYGLGYIAARDDTTEAVSVDDNTDDDAVRHRADQYVKRILRTMESFEAFRDRHLGLEAEIEAPEFSSYCRFLEAWDTEQALKQALLGEISSGFGVVRLVGSTNYVHDSPRIRQWWQRQHDDVISEDCQSRCLVTGALASAASIHSPAIKGVKGQQSSGAKLVSFNCDAFESYGREQGLNAPVSELAAFRYATALNSLTTGPCSKRHRFSIGDTTVVFWTEKPTATESWLSDLFSGELPEDAQDRATLEQVDVLLKALRRGGGELSALGDDPAVGVCILGLAANAARLSVRFWYQDSLARLFDRLREHYRALRIVPEFVGPKVKRSDPEFPANWMLLRETARESKDIPPLLAGALLRAVLYGTAYPNALASAVILRIRADRKIDYIRAAILKAWLIRLYRFKGGIPVSLDIDRVEPAYRLGRLFAVLEKTQTDALKGINATIRDRFYGAASATPATVFPRLLRTYQHHLAKLENVGQKVNREKLLQEIMEKIDNMPNHLGLEAQGLFAIGYYHQRTAFYTKHEVAGTNTTASADNCTEE